MVQDFIADFNTGAGGGIGYVAGKAGWGAIGEVLSSPFGSVGEPFLHPIDTWNGLKEFANSDDKLAVLRHSQLYLN